MKYNTSDTNPCIIYVCDIRVLHHQLGMRENFYDIFINKCKCYWRIRQSNVRLICSFHITENCNINNYINVREYCRGNQKWTIQNILQQDEEKHNTICVRHRFTETNTNNINNTNISAKKDWFVQSLYIRTVHRYSVEVAYYTSYSSYLAIMCVNNRYHFIFEVELNISYFRILQILS